MSITILALVFLAWYILYGWDGLKRDFGRLRDKARVRFPRQKSLDRTCPER